MNTPDFLLGHHGKRVPDLLRVPYFHGQNLYVGLLRRGLDVRKKHGSVGGIDQDGHARQLRHHAAQNFQILGTEFHIDARDSGDVATWPSQGLDQSAADRVVDGSHDDGNGGGCFLRRAGGDRARCHDDVHFQLHQFRRQRWKALNPAVGMAQLDHQVLALDVAELAHCLWEAAVNCVGIETSHATQCKETDAPDFARLLGERRQRRP